MTDKFSKEYYIEALADFKESAFPHIRNTAEYGGKIVEYIFNSNKEQYTLEEFIRINFPDSAIFSIELGNFDNTEENMSDAINALNQTQYCLNYLSDGMGKERLLNHFIMFKDDESGKEYLLNSSAFSLAYHNGILYHPDTQEEVVNPLSKMYMVYKKV